MLINVWRLKNLTFLPNTESFNLQFPDIKHRQFGSSRRFRNNKETSDIRDETKVIISISVLVLHSVSEIKNKNLIALTG
jgi:hypothetical protein